MPRRLFACAFLAATLAAGGGLVAEATAKDNVVVTNRCGSRLRLFVRAYDANGYDNYGWWVFAPGEKNQVLSQKGVRLIHDHSKKLFFYAEGIGNNLLWNDGPETTRFEGDRYKLSMTENTDDDNDTPVYLTCKGR